MGRKRMSAMVIATLVTVMAGFPAIAAKKAQPPGGGSGASTSYSGRATVIDATVLSLLDVTLVDTGPLPAKGGALHEHLLEVSVPGLLTAEVLHASTVGDANSTRSEASVANLELTAAGATIGADFLMARASAECSPSSLSASSEIVGLTLNELAVDVSGSPNQTIEFPGGRLIINEQMTDSNGITVNALHLVVDGLADVIVSHANAGISCSGPSCESAGDFVTGGGWITGTPTADRGNFGVAGGIMKKGLWGHLTYIDHGSGMKVKATEITAYTVIDDVTRRIDGEALVNQAVGYTFTVVVADHGEPGRQDTFDLTVSNGYSATGQLDGGNIQLHKPSKACK